jgi:hypothetical protein
MMGDSMEINRIVCYSCIALSAVALFGALMLGNAMAAAACSFFAAFAILLWKYGTFFGPAITGFLGVRQKWGNLEVPPSFDMVFLRTRDGFVASGFLGIRLHKSVSEMSEGAAIEYSRMFERAISSAKYVTKFSVLASNIPVDDYLDSLREKRSFAESKKAHLAEDGARASADVARLEREVAMYSRLIEKIGGGRQPMEVICYAMSSADGKSREEAAAKLRTQLSELGATLAGVLDCRVDVMRGEDLQKCTLWEAAIPQARDRLAEEAL